MLVDVVALEAKLKGGVHEMLVDVVAVVPVIYVSVVDHGNLYEIRCLNELSCLLMVIVMDVPKVPFPTVSVDFRAIVVSVFDAFAVIVPLETPVVKEAEHDKVFAPFDPCVTFTVFSKIT